MADTFAEIPDRDQFKASEVCEIAKVQSYVLRSWEQEFPNLGVVRSAGGQRIYRRGDVERILRIKQLVFGEGLTLAGARRRLDGTEPAVAPPDVSEDVLAIRDDEARVRLSTIRRDLRSLLDMLEDRPVPVSATTDEALPAQPALPEMGGEADDTRQAQPALPEMGGEADDTRQPVWPLLRKPRAGKRKAAGEGTSGRE